MLPKEKRISLEKDFKRAYQKGSFFATPLFHVNYLVNNLGFSRLGIVISKKIEPKSVKRNQIKRKFREASRQLYDLLPKGYDFVINVKKSALDADFSEIKQELEKFAKTVKK